ncbi:DNA methylase N-4/N-6 domain-containing protein [Haemophilus parahaemolyticus]|uniref:site-specific DNA-methyltransferase (adenine-specific) n=1 Tax=Haemophilus parahaemolyticus TaxID=735 RepID=A0A377I261_HAEPH|nr:site-specific DNA-methyltransferase [Haemophilus parahaemolyticus]STO64439.1 DNA methylase N-4/N-6 domain-containing protein [Haemophilus parahaemolyticus]
MPHLTSPHLAQLISKLKEIFQINQPELDFGIYRILNSRATEIAAFLETTLPQKIQTALAGKPEQETAVYNYLFTFFSRYYDNGDFISQRRYKADTYAIPYAGEEVMLHWANKDQYYTKSGESFSNYAFTLENGKKVQFRLVEADTAKDNRKDNDQARVFALIEPQIKTETDENGDEIQADILPFDIQDDLLTLRFEYKSVNKKEKQSDYITQAVGKIQNFAIPDKFQGIFNAMPTEKNKNRTLLEKYLTDYTAKNTADYFIHKNLGKFLNQELDFYIKNEVMNLDNIQESTDFSHIEQNLRTIKTLKTVAKEIITFLAQLENFQKKLWLKKKFVAGCYYLITLDHLNEAQIQAALDNPKQIAQWQALFHVNTSGLNAAELCKNYPHLVVDTVLFEQTFQADVLREIEYLDDKTSGLLIHSDNFQALNLLQERYKEQVKCIYIDPPYNTGGDGFLYKDGYQASSWSSLISDRLNLAKEYLNKNGTVFISIDENEIARLKLLCDQILGVENFVAIYKWNKTSTPPSLSLKVRRKYEYVLCYEKQYSSIAYNGGTVEGGDMPLLNNGNFIAKLIFPKTALKFNIEGNFKPAQYDRVILHNEINVKNGYADSDVILEAPFKWIQDTLDLEISNGTKFIIKTDRFAVRYERLGERIKRPSDILSKTECEVGTNEDANKEVSALFGNSDIASYPKPTTLIKYLVPFAEENKDSLVMDYFAGSGTTAHAVINLNREDKGNRKYVLVEQGEYFDSVLKPRVQKVIFAKEWKDGKPQLGNGSFGGVSQIVKVLKLESYEDTLNNLELRKPAQDLADMGLSETVQNDYLLHYMLDVESRDSLLNTQHFTKPFNYQLNIATTSAGAYEVKTIDLVETFNYLIGLRVSEINDKRENGLVTVQGTNTSGEKTLVIWRDCEKYDYDKLNRYLDSRDINPQDSEFDVVYINGDHNMTTVFTDSDDSMKTLKVRSIEAEFLGRMFG